MDLDRTDFDRHHEAREEAESANRMKDEFLATVSHELRNPLNAILGWSHLLRFGNLDSAKFARALEIIERNVRSQVTLIDEILDVARVTHGKLRLNLGTVDVIQVAEAALVTVRPLADAKEIALESVLEAAEPLEVTGDADRLQQVVWNLLSNAIKFTHRGGWVRIQLQGVGPWIELTVSDNGRGIRPDFLPFIFDRFRQAESGWTRTHGGLGLGLAISRELVELHNGSIRAQSPGEGMGAAFTVKFPLRPVSGDATIVPRAEPPSRISLTGIKVLLVDDDQDVRDVAIEVLTDCGAQAMGASSAQEALATMRIWRPDVLVSDIGMPLEDGYELIRKVRALDPEEGGSIPACAMSGWGAIGESERNQSTGFQLHISKPIDSKRLIETVYHLAEGSLRESNGARSPR